MYRNNRHHIRLALLAFFLLLTGLFLVSCVGRKSHDVIGLTSDNGEAVRIARQVYSFPGTRAVGHRGMSATVYDFQLPDSGNIIHASLCFDRRKVYWGYHPVYLNGIHVGSVVPNSYTALYSRPKSFERTCVDLPMEELVRGDNSLSFGRSGARETFELKNGSVTILQEATATAGETDAAALPEELAFLEPLTEKEQYIVLVKSPEIRSRLMNGQQDHVKTTANALSLLGDYHGARGDYVSALDAQKRAVALGRQHSSSLLATYLVRLGESHAFLGDTEGAEVAFREALDLERSGAAASVTNGRDAAMGKKGTARKRLSPAGQEIMARMALMSLKLGDIDRAESLAEQLVEEAGGTDFYTYVDKKAWWNPVPLSMAYMVMGEVNLRQGYYPEAMQAFEDAYVFLPSINGGLEHRAIYGLAETQFRDGQDDEALETLQRIRGSNHATRWKSDLLKGRILEGKGQLERAVEAYAASIEAIEMSRSHLGDHQYKVSFMDDKQQPYARIISCLLRLGRDAEALKYAERAKARAFVDLLANREDIRHMASHTTDQQTTMRRLAALERQGTSSDQGSSSVRAVDAEAVRKTLRSQSLKLASLVMVETPDIRSIREHLGDNEVLVEYFIHGGEGAVFAVSRDGMKSAVIDTAGLVQSVKRFRQALSNPSDSRWKEEAQALHKRLLAPVNALLEDQTLVIVPHGVLHYLPFGALMDEGRVMVEDHAIRVLPSAAVQAQLHNGAPASRSILILGNPDLGDAGMDLPGAEAEARQVRQLWPESRVLLRQNASETLFRESAPHFGSLHVAAHGQFSPFAPLESALLLSPDEHNDGRLTVAELYGLRLNTDLVVLSACESGLGAMRSGDEMVSLTRGFFYAGTRSILASLWQIPDAETTFLMEAFHARHGDTGWAESLRQAQLASYRRFGHPYYWAGFELFGL